MTAPWTGVVLAGGRSRRMGTPKALLPHSSGVPWVEAALESLRSAGTTQLLVSDQSPSELAQLALPLVEDNHPGKGPIAGIEAALRVAQTPWCVVVACDMPSLDPQLLQEVAARTAASGPGCEAVIPLSPEGLQPLHAAYHRRCLPKLERALAEGKLRLMQLLEQLEVERFPCEPSESFFNANSPGDI